MPGRMARRTLDQQAVRADEGRAGRDVAVDAVRLHLFSMLSHRGDGKSGAQRYARLG